MDKMNFKTLLSCLLTSCSCLAPLYGKADDAEPMLANSNNSYESGFLSPIDNKPDNNAPLFSGLDNLSDGGLLAPLDDNLDDSAPLFSDLDMPFDEGLFAPLDDKFDDNVSLFSGFGNSSESERLVPIDDKSGSDQPTLSQLNNIASESVCKKEDNEKQPVLYYADSQTYDRELGILILKGHVEFSYQGNILEADCVTYNESTDIVTASGNVRLRQPDGDVNFADYLELTGNMKEGVVLHLRTLLKDDSKVAALEGRKFEDRQELDQAVYTPCKLCGDSFPTWQVNARRAVKDDVNKDMIFTDAEFRLLDVPLMYLPYATQPLERRSGFLLPQPNFSSDFGAVIEIPYYIVLSEDKDITITPVIFSKNHPLLLGEYRQAFGSGIFNVEGSITKYKKSTKDKKKEKDLHYDIPNTRGHVFGQLKTNLNEIWRLKLEGGYVSDKTYFRKYALSGWRTQNALTSEGILEGFLNQRDYAAIKAYHFQGLRIGLDHQKRISAPLPIMEYSAYSGTDPLGGRFKFDGNLLNLYRQKGINMQRGIGEVSWQRPWNTSLGQVFTIFALTRGDLYKVEHSHNIGEKNRHERSLMKKDREHQGGARFFPQTGFDWRWPFINSFCQQSVVVQPMSQLILAPSHPLGASNRKIPNEDSVDFSFNDANIFSPDRFPGYDRIDRGSRVVYGGEVLTTGTLFGDIELFLGQSYSLVEPQDRRDFQGLKNRSSDYVGRLEANPYSWLSFNYRFRLDEKTFHSRVVEAGGSIGPEVAKFSGTYLFMSRHAFRDENILLRRGKKKYPHVQGKKNFNQMNLTFSSQFTENWTFSANLLKNLEKRTREEKLNNINDHHGILSHGIGLMYRDDCFGLGFSLTRQYYKSADLRPTTIGLVTLWLKNVGDHSFSFDLNPEEQGLFGSRKPSNDTP